MDEVLVPRPPAARRDRPPGRRGRLPGRAVRHRPARRRRRNCSRSATGFAPAKATDHRGRDVTADAAATATAGRRGRVRPCGRGSASPRTTPSSSTSATDSPGCRRQARLFLVLAGWTDYPYPESIYAAAQAGVPMPPPVLERQAADGNVGAARRPRLPGRAAAGDDRASVTGGWPARRAGSASARTCRSTGTRSSSPRSPTRRRRRSVALPVARATLAHRGFMQEVTPDGSGRRSRTTTTGPSRWPSPAGRGTLTRTRRRDRAADRRPTTGSCCAARATR